MINRSFTMLMFFALILVTGCVQNAVSPPSPLGHAPAGEEAIFMGANIFASSFRADVWAMNKSGPPPASTTSWATLSSTAAPSASGREMIRSGATFSSSRAP